MRALPDAAGLTLRASVVDVATGAVGRRGRPARDADEVHTGELPPLPAGDYRLRVEGVDVRHRWPTPCTRCCASSTTPRPTTEP